MKPEDLFSAIGGVESSRLQRTELSAQPSRTPEEEPNMHPRNFKKLTRNLLIAVAVLALLSVTVYAASVARIRLEVTKYQQHEPVTEETTTESCNVEIDFQRTTNEYLELPSCYPQLIPEGIEIGFVSDASLGFQRIVYQDEAGEFAFDFTAELGSDGLQRYLEKVVNEEAVTVCGCPGTIYTTEGGARTIVWFQETQGVGYVMYFADPTLDILAIANSVAQGEPLTPTRASGTQKALGELGDYRITALPEGFQQTDFMASPLEDGGGWYAYVRRWYGDTVTTEGTIYLEYESFRLVSDEPKDSSHPLPDVENTPETVIAMYGGGEPTELCGMPGTIQEGQAVWVDWDAQVCFRIIASGRSADEVAALAQSVREYD